MKVIENAAELAVVRPLWELLYRESPSATLFQSFAWNEIVAHVFADRERPYVVIAESDSGAAIIPACTRAEEVSFLGEELFDYRDVLRNDAASLELAWEEVAKLKLPLQVKAVRGRVPWAKNRAFAGAPYLRKESKVRPNKDLERNLRNLRSRDWYFGTLTPSDESFRASVRRMYTLKGAHPRGSLFADPRRIDAVVEMAVTADSELHLVGHGDNIASAVLTFIDGSVCRFYGIYYDDRWKQLSPGVTLLYHVIQLAQARGLDFDFMTGEQPYKLRFASEVVPLFIATRTADIVEAIAA